MNDSQHRNTTAENKESDVMLPCDTMKWMFDLAAGDDCKRALSPLLTEDQAVWRHFPRMLVCAADDEILLGDSRRLCELIEQHGSCEVVRHVQRGVFHTWPLFWQHLPEAHASMLYIADFIAETLFMDCGALPVHVQQQQQ
jgi:acetyl esterase/lipase